MRPGGLFATLLVGALLGVFRLLPASARRALARAGAALAFALGIRKKVALENLAHAFPDWSDAERVATARRCYQSLAQTAVEGVTSDRIPEAELDQAVHVADWGALGRALEAGGVLLASAHLGSWELLAEVMARRRIKLSCVVRPLEGAFNAQVVRARQAAGVELILQRGALPKMITAVGKGRCVVQLIDQSVPPQAGGVFVPFFGRAACTTPALAMAAVRTRAPVFFAVATRVEGRLELFFEGPVPVPDTKAPRADAAALTATLTGLVERYVRRFPDQWLWLHRRWKEKPPAPLESVKHERAGAGQR
ncbi:MAG: lysophospholipid acyltransferase family protein [Archangiaceae bacterium]|nr:lysophospholipid acyltransferase family protein [Archangiaceae bacterium]